MKYADVYAANRKMILELKPEKQWAAFAWLDACWFRGVYFRITEVYRTPERQRYLYEQGRTRPGPIVTSTLKSKHMERLAVDVVPIPGGYSDYRAYDQLVKVAAQLHISNPISWDKPHFQFDYVGDPPQPVLPYGVQLANVIKAIGRYAGRTLSKIEEMRLRLLGRKKDRLEDLIEEEK